MTEKSTDGTARCPDCGTELEAVRRRGEFETLRVSGRCQSCEDWMVIEASSDGTAREAQVQTLAPICQIAREADSETMELLESVLVQAHGREVIDVAWSRAEENARGV